MRLSALMVLVVVKAVRWRAIGSSLTAIGDRMAVAPVAPGPGAEVEAGSGLGSGDDWSGGQPASAARQASPDEGGPAAAASSRTDRSAGSCWSRATRARAARMVTS